jgi:hypothetical protein
LLVFSGAEEESGAAEVIDEPGDALGVVIESGEEGIGEELVVVADEAEMMFDVAGGLLEVEGREGVADGDALVEGLIGGKAEFVEQVRLSHEDESEKGVGIHLIVEEEAELVEEVGGEEVSFINDEEGEALFAGQVAQNGVKLREEAGEGVGRFNL